MGKWLKKIKKATPPTTRDSLPLGDYLLYIRGIFEKETERNGDMHVAKVTVLEGEDVVANSWEEEKGSGNYIDISAAPPGTQTDIPFFTENNDMAMGELMSLISCMAYQAPKAIFEEDPKDAEKLIEAASIEEDDLDDSEYAGMLVRARGRAGHGKDSGKLWTGFKFQPVTEEEQENAEELLEAVQ